MKKKQYYTRKYIVDKYVDMSCEAPSKVYSTIIPNPLHIAESYKCKGKGRYMEYSRNTLTMPLLHSREMVDYAFKTPARSSTKRLKGKRKCSVS